MPLKNTDLASLITLFEKSGLKEMHLIYEGDELYLSRETTGGIGAMRAESPAAPVPALAAAPVAAAAPAAPAAPAAGAAASREGWVAVRAANLGTFYRASKPDAEPYVSVGAKVAPATEICMIEVMKLFTTLTAGVSGIVREIVVQDGEMVEFDQILMWIEPEA